LTVGTKVGEERESGSEGYPVGCCGTATCRTVERRRESMGYSE